MPIPATLEEDEQDVDSADESISADLMWLRRSLQNFQLAQVVGFVASNRSG